MTIDDNQMTMFFKVKSSFGKDQEIQIYFSACQIDFTGYTSSFSTSTSPPILKR